ncbi:hypothetical protein M9H77_36721 [Catharanthus roseus]|uniref:Uncharacterized protein n=1 Tax=Catharanthus roseus TaxID=4058 RepID=A0ACB9ZTY7_CATRO|nr:hypothetical protein M9H77_36721 [Catharanthus roseus]
MIEQEYHKTTAFRDGITEDHGGYQRRATYAVSRGREGEKKKRQRQLSRRPRGIWNDTRTEEERDTNRSRITMGSPGWPGPVSLTHSNFSHLSWFEAHRFIIGF